MVLVVVENKADVLHVKHIIHLQIMAKSFLKEYLTLKQTNWELDREAVIRDLRNRKYIMLYQYHNEQL